MIPLALRSAAPLARLALRVGILFLFADD